MLGFTESFNISVAAALSMYALSSRLRKENINWQLSELDKEELRLQWLRNTIPKVELIEKDFLEKQK
jgi:tRNA (guanosine-2'-O-)-methyltransferase